MISGHIVEYLSSAKMLRFCDICRSVLFVT